MAAAANSTQLAVQLGDLVRCSNSIAFPRKTFPFREELRVHDATLKNSSDRLKFTGNIEAGPVQMHVYHRILATLVAARQAAGQREVTVCETGFNAGHSALIFLLTHPSVRYYGFELRLFKTSGSGHKRWASQHAEALLAAQFPGRIKVTFGDSHKTIVPFFDAHSDIQCDMLSIDGDHSYTGVLLDMQQLEPNLRDGGVIVADDCEQGFLVGKERSQDAMFRGYAKHVLARLSSLKALRRVTNCERGKPGKFTPSFCIAAKGSAPKSLLDFISNFP